MHRFIRLAIVHLTLATMVSAVPDGYNMPDAVTVSMPAGEAMKRMENAVKPEVLAEFKKQHPARFWLFGEDRQFAVRKNIVPAHWLENGAKQFQQFSGTARPGEFYVFQVCVVGGGKKWFDSFIGGRITHTPDGSVVDRSPSDHGEVLGLKDDFRRFPGDIPLQLLSRGGYGDTFEFNPGEVSVLWFGIQIPANAKQGAYHGEIEIGATEWFTHTPSGSPIKDGNPSENRLRFVITVEGELLQESGTNDAWRLARLKWLDSTAGTSERVVTRPFTPLRLDSSARTIDLLGRRVTLGENGIPTRLTSFFSASNTRILPAGRDAFSTPPRFEVETGGKVAALEPTEFKFTKQTPVAVEWLAVSKSGDLTVVVTGRLEFDGFLKLGILPQNNKQPQVDDIRFIIPFAKDAAKYAMGLGLKGQATPARHDWKWDVNKHQDAIWLGDVNIGSMLRFKESNFQRPLINAYYDFSPLNLPESWGGGGVRLENHEGMVTLTSNSGKIDISAGSKVHSQATFDIDWYLTPFKPLDVKKHFTDRYYHIGQHAAVEDTAKLRAEGANIIEIHHNRLCNPYINYPFNDDSFGRLKDFVKKAHGDDMRVNLYYTTRELTQNLPEFFALKSMGGEIILPRREGVGWPVTNRQGPHPWLVEHVGRDIVPAWREELKFPEYPAKLDLAVITTPDSRWNNFYLEGLDYLVRKAGIDGLYIDDTALDRTSMQRARRILDADGNTGRRISMHSWNHHNGLAKWSNSAIAFMELFPYYDGLWFGEGFNADMPPEYMLVEMSGIPYGLMGEMLDHPNPWHGMVFGMRTRWPWSGDPRPMWKLEDIFGITDSEFIGWWDSECPVRTNHPRVKASVFRRKGSTLVALASWAPDPVKVRLDTDWKALGLDPSKASLWAPACANFQPEKVFAATAEIPVSPGRGWVFIVDEKPREISSAPADPLHNRKVLAETPRPLDIKAPANTVSTNDLPWVDGATAAAARIEPGNDAGQAWGVGLAVGWPDGRHIQIHARTDGRWGIRHNGSETLIGSHPRGAPATIAVLLEKEFVRVMAREDSGDWETLAEYPRAEFPGAPAAARYGKIGQGWNSGNFGDPGPAGNCRVAWVRMY